MFITNMINLENGAEFETCEYTSEFVDGGKGHYLRISENANTVSIFFKNKEQMQNMALALMIEIQKAEAEGMKNAEL
jgi:hypothetical protein